MISEALPEFPPVPWNIGARARRGVRGLCPTSRLGNRIAVDIRQMQMRIKSLQFVYDNGTGFFPQPEVPRFRNLACR